MKVVFSYAPDSLAGFNGCLTLFKKCVDSIPNSHAIFFNRDWKPKNKPYKTRDQELGSIFEKNQYTLTNEEETFVKTCNEADAVFFLSSIDKPYTQYYVDLINSLQTKKFLMIVGGSGMSRSRKHMTGIQWDGCWCLRQEIRDSHIRLKLIDKDLPFVMGPNPYQMKCPYTPEELVQYKNKNKIITNTRMSSFKNPDYMFDLISELSQQPRNIVEMWGIEEDEPGTPQFLRLFKCVPRRHQKWNTLKSIRKGSYTPSDFEKIMLETSFAMDFTNNTTDAVRWNDGGLQYCQMEAIEWGVIPVCLSDFYVDEEFDSIMKRYPKLEKLKDPFGEYSKEELEKIVNDIQKTMDELSDEEHIEYIRKGREYIQKNNSYQKLSDSIYKLIEMVIK